jgi:hypothetical protein
MDLKMNKALGRELAGVAVFTIVGIVRLALAPAKQPAERASAVVA